MIRFGFVNIIMVVFLLTACGSGDSDSGGGDDGGSDLSLIEYISGKSLRLEDTNYTYLLPDKHFYSYANIGSAGWIYHGEGNTGTWSADDQSLKLFYTDGDVWTYRIDENKHESTLIENGDSYQIGAVFPIVATPQGLIDQVEKDHGSGSNDVITSAELSGDWIVQNLTQAHSITVKYSSDNKLYRAVGDMIDDKGFVDQDSWSIGGAGKLIIHSEVTHTLTKKEAGCYFTRATSSSDNEWVNEYKLCGGEVVIEGEPGVVTQIIDEGGITRYKTDYISSNGSIISLVSDTEVEAEAITFEEGVLPQAEDTEASKSGNIELQLPEQRDDNGAIDFEFISENFLRIRLNQSVESTESLFKEVTFVTDQQATTILSYDGKHVYQMPISNHYGTNELSTHIDFSNSDFQAVAIGKASQTCAIDHNKDNVEIKFGDGKATVTSLNLPCIRSVYYENKHDSKDFGVVPDGVTSVELSGYGKLYELLFKYELNAKTIRFGAVAWKQEVYLPDYRAENIPYLSVKDLAEGYKPYLSFHDEEKYFPISFESIFNAIDSYGGGVLVKERFGPDIMEIKSSDQMKKFLSYNGNSEYSLVFDDSIIRSVKGVKDSSVIYWDYLMNGNDIYITYHMFYSFDPKDGDEDDNKLGAHNLDRESFTIRFSPNPSEGFYEPAYVTYAGHLSTSKMYFIGCQDTQYGINCVEPNSDLESNYVFGLDSIEWNGKVSIKWSNVVKTGNDRPIIYIAKGAHAVYPAFGWYVIKAAGIGFYEFAGNNSCKLSDPILLELNLKKDRFTSFSGNWVRSFKGVFDAKFPPFSGRHPYNVWLSKDSYDYDNGNFDASYSTGGYIKNETSFAFNRCIEGEAISESEECAIIYRYFRPEVGRCTDKKIKVSVNVNSASAKAASAVENGEITKDPYISLVYISDGKVGSLTTPYNVGSKLIDYQKNNPYEFTFENLQPGIYQAQVSLGNVAILDSRRIDLSDENSVTEVFEVDLTTVEQNAKFTSSSFLPSDTWTIKNCSNDRKAFDIRFLSGGGVEDVDSAKDGGFSSTDQWSVSETGLLELMFPLIPAHKLTHTPTLKWDNCFNVQATDNFSGLNVSYKMCRNIDPSLKSSFECDAVGR